MHGLLLRKENEKREHCLHFHHGGRERFAFRFVVFSAIGKSIRNVVSPFGERLDGFAMQGALRHHLRHSGPRPFLRRHGL